MRTLDTPLRAEPPSAGLPRLRAGRAGATPALDVPAFPWLRLAMRRFVVVGQRASAAADFSLTDLPGSSGRLDVLLRCLRAALLVSHGLRRDTLVYLVLNGGPRAPRTLRFDGQAARFVRPDERSLALLTYKALAEPASGPEFTEVRSGVAVADGGLDLLLPQLAAGTPFVLEEQARDFREIASFGAEPLFFVGDHLGFEPGARAALAAFGATPISVGPLSIHAEDAVTLASNELDRRQGETPGMHKLELSTESR